MEAYSNRLSRMVKETLQDRINEQSARLANVPAEDFSGYKHRVGSIQGLREALEIVKDAENELDRPEGNKETVPAGGRRYED
jgi:hypothetical protein